jgi:hypothetical protein
LREARRRFARRAAAPAAVAAARLRARPGRSLLLAAGVAGATAMLIGVLGGGLVARDRAVRSALAGLPASDRSFRVDSFDLPPGQSYGSADRTARHVLASLTTQEPLAGTFFRQLLIGNGLVELTSLDHVGTLVRLQSGRLPRECTPARCEVLQVGPGTRSSWRQEGINLVRVGIADVPDAAVLGPWLEPGSGTTGSHPTRLIASGANAFRRIPALDGLYRVYSWIDPVAPGAIHTWQIGGVLARESRAQTALADAGAEYELSGPDTALEAAQTTAGVAGQRLSLIGGEISVLLLGFALVAAVGLRRGLAAERQRLVQRGASAMQVLVSVVSEIGATTLAGGVVGVLGGVAAVVVVAHRTGLPWGAVLRHGPSSPSGIAFVLLLWLVATVALVAVAVRRPEASSARRVRIPDVLALAAAGAAAIGFARGGVDAGTLASGSDATFLLLLPGLVCFAAAVAAARLLGPLMRGAERLTRRSPPALRLAMLGLARAPARTAATAAFLVVAAGLALFATAYRATLQQGAGDEAAFAVPLDYTLSEGPSLVTPLEAAPVATFDRIAPGVQAYPVVRQTADVPGAGTSDLNPTVLGLAPGALARLHWRSDFAALPLSTLAARIEAAPQASLRGLQLPRGAAISLQARESGVGVELDLAAQSASGDVILLPLHERGTSGFTARTPAAGPLKLVGLEISVVSGEAAALAHRAAESTEATIPRGSIVLGPLRSGARTLTDWRGWVAPGASLDTRGQIRVSYAFTTGQTVLVRRPQATDGRPLLVIASPSVASAAGPDGTLVLDFGVGRVPARIVAVAARFPDSDQHGEGFIVADESRLEVALDASLPGTGRATELWVSAPAAHSAQVARALTKPPFSPLVVASRSELERALAADPLARGVTLTLAAAALVAVALAVVALWLALAGELADERGELLDLEAQGVAPETLRRQFRLRAAALTAAALAGGIVLGLILSRLIVALVRLSAGGTTPEPPLRFEAAWTVDAIGLAAVVLAAAVVVELTTRRAFRGESAGRPSWSLE